MNKILILGGLLIGGAVVLNKCGLREAQTIPFQGTWNFIDENTVMGKTDRATVQVATDGKRFRIVSKTRDYDYESENIQVYDGQNLHTRYTSIYQGNSLEPTEDSSQPTPNQLKSLKFWSELHSSGEKSGPGGPIAGRDTHLYQVRMNRPDGELTGQAWLDAETSLLMKSVVSVFSSQINSNVFKSSKECIEIRYEEPDPQLFQKP